MKNILLALFLFYMYGSQTQISEKYFMKNLIHNVTGITIYDDQWAYIKINNMSSAKHYISMNHTHDDFNDFISNSDMDILYKKMYFKVENIINYLMLLGFVGILLMRSSGLFSSKAIFSEDKANVKLKDVAGLKTNKQGILEFVDFLKNREKYIKAGAKMPRGALFYGPPGTGKTLLAKAIAGECGIPFLHMAGSDFSEMFVGVGAARIRNLFKTAREKAPCIMFIDEIDALAKTRSSLSHHEKDNTLNRFLVELDGFNENDNVLIIGATNRLDILDKALLRPGRFDRKIAFQMPEKNEREKIFEHYLKKMKCEKFSKHLSDLSFGFSCADIANVCNEACILSVRRNIKHVTLELIEEAIDNVILGPKNETFELCKKEKRTIAYHEAGHAVASHFLEHAQPPIKVSIMPRGKSALGFSQSSPPDTKLMTKEEILDKICVLLGGRIAEEIFFKTLTTGASDDIEKATLLAEKFVTTFGMSNDIRLFHFKVSMTYGESLMDARDTAMRRTLSTCYDKTKKLLMKKKNRVEEMAELLLKHETLDHELLSGLFSKFSSV